jgi:hypothetical protein
MEQVRIEQISQGDARKIKSFDEMFNLLANRVNALIEVVNEQNEHIITLQKELNSLKTKK